MGQSTAAARSAFAMRTDPGRVRTHNEDACAADAALGVFVVCDGIGGEAAGEVASHLAAATVVEALRSGVAAPAPDAEDLGARLDEALRRANAAVLSAGKRARHLHGMGTTIVALLLGAEADSAPGMRTFAVAHAGDSRCYRLRAGELEMITAITATSRSRSAQAR